MIHLVLIVISKKNTITNHKIESNIVYIILVELGSFFALSNKVSFVSFGL
jgi:hypothetical protein